MMILSPLGGAGTQFFDSDGEVLSGGKLYVYEAGTTTPVTVYTTSAASVAHANPITLDSAGRVPSGGQVWVDDATSHKFVLKTSAGATVATWDNTGASGYLNTLVAGSGITITGSGQTRTIATSSSFSGSNIAVGAGLSKSGTTTVTITPSQDMCRVTNNGFFYTSGADTKVTFTAESFDTNTMFTAPSDTVTVKRTGYYRISVRNAIYYQSKASAVNVKTTLKVERSGLLHWNDWIDTKVPANNPTANQYHTINELLRLETGDTVHVLFYHDYGSTVEAVTILAVEFARP